MSITLEQYSEKAIVLFGETEKVKDRIKALGGKYNSNLKGRPGWVFTNSSRPKLEAFLQSLEDGTTVEIPQVQVKANQCVDSDVISELIRRIAELEAKVEKLQTKQPVVVDNTSECDEPEPEKPKRLLKRK